MGKQETIPFITEDGEEIKFYIMEQTMISGINYLLVTEDLEDEEAEVMMMKENPDSDGEYASYEFVEDDDELNAISKIFSELMEDVDIEIVYD